MEPYSTQCIETDIGFCSSSKYSRSNLSSRSIESSAGVIDSDFQRNVKVVFHNLSNKQVEFETGNRIAQVVFQKVKSPVLLEVSDFKDFTERNKQGFGLAEARNN